MKPRQILKRWRNGPGGKWTCRITWYDDGEGGNVRLACEDGNERHDFYPDSLERAEVLWEYFKREATNGDGFLTEMVETMGAVDGD